MAPFSIEGKILTENQIVTLGPDRSAELQSEGLNQVRIFPQGDVTIWAGKKGEKFGVVYPDGDGVCMDSVLVNSQDARITGAGKEIVVVYSREPKIK